MEASLKQPEIAMIINSKGVKGFVVLGETLEMRKKSLALMDFLKPELIEVQDQLDGKIQKNSFCELN